MAGQEGFEPPTSGFGDRRSNRSSYWPVFAHLLAFAVKGMSPAKLAELFEGKPIGCTPLVLGGRIIPALTFSTG